jgi:hypothetical protein
VRLPPAIGLAGRALLTRSRQSTPAVVAWRAGVINQLTFGACLSAAGSNSISRYIVAVGLLAFIYTTLQLVRHGVRLSGGQDLQGKVGLLVDFAGDQVSKATSAFVLAYVFSIPHLSNPRCCRSGICLGSTSVSFKIVCLVSNVKDKHDSVHDRESKRYLQGIWVSTNFCILSRVRILLIEG